MYTLHIQNENVRKNLALVVETIRHSKSQTAHEQHKKTLEFSIDLQTGLLQLPKAGNKRIQIHLDLDKHRVSISDLQDHQLFNFEKMDLHGRQVLSETAHYLKLALLHLHSIQEFAHIEFKESLDEIMGRELLREGWHAVERNEAELMLLNSTPGTYLFRKDRFARLMEEILSSAKQSRIRCYTLSYLDPQRQVREKTIVTWKDHWIFYDDDPTLSGKYFESLETLLTSLGTLLKKPLPVLTLS